MSETSTMNWHHLGAAISSLRDNCTYRAEDARKIGSGAGVLTAEEDKAALGTVWLHALAGRDLAAALRAGRAPAEALAEYDRTAAGQ